MCLLPSTVVDTHILRSKYRRILAGTGLKTMARLQHMSQIIAVPNNKAFHFSREPDFSSNNTSVAVMY
jgi:hypothetical protein